MRKILFASLLILASAIVAAHAADDRAAQLGKLYAEFWEEDLKLDPVGATFAGDPRYNADLPNFLSQEYRDQERAFHQGYLDRARAIGAEGLTGQDRLSYEIFTLNRASELEAVTDHRRLLPVKQSYKV